MNKSDTVPERFAKTRARLYRLALLLTAPLLIASSASLAGSAWWLFENVSEFSAQIALAETLLLAPWVFLVVTKIPPRPSTLVPAGLLSVFWICHVILIAPLWLGSASGAKPGEGTLKVMSVNVLTSNEDFESVIEAVETEKPEVLVLLEIDAAWRKALKPLEKTFSCIEWREREDNFGIAIMSRVPGTRTGIFKLAGEAQRLTTTPHALVPWEGGAIEVIGVHLLPPVSPDYAKRNRAQAEALAEYVKNQKHPCVLAGDFNHTPWSPTFRRLVREAGLAHGRRGRGLVATWPAGRPWMRLPIDHVLAAPPLEIVSFRRLPAGGSDHNPVVAELVLR